jgi:hypothetical protein
MTDEYYIKNLTSDVPVSRSIARIFDRLVQCGATNITQTIDENKKVSGITFTLEVKGNTVMFKLPANSEKVEQILIDTIKLKHHHPAYERTVQTKREQAAKTSWKILVDWVEVQLSLITLEQARPEEVFLPYLYLPNKDMTLFQFIDKDSNNLKLLTSGK